MLTPRLERLGADTIRLVRRNPLTEFTNQLLAAKSRIRRLYLVSPWIVTSRAAAFRPFSRVFSIVNERRIELVVVCRRPDRPAFFEAIKLLEQLDRCEIAFLDALHAKIYLMEADGLVTVYVGSPNFTLEGDSTNREIAVEITTTAPLEERTSIASDIHGFILDLLCDPATILHKPIARTRPQTRKTTT